jgi:EpsI family protein
MEKKHKIKIGWQFYVALLLIILSGMYARNSIFAEITVEKTPLKGFPHVLGTWENIGNYNLGNGLLDILKVDDYIMGNYRNEHGLAASLYIGYYQTHRRFAEIHTPEHCQAGGGWEILNSKDRNIEIPSSSEQINFVEAVYQKDREKMLFLYWYYINGKYITNFFKYKFSIIKNSLLYHRSDASFVRITVPIKNDDVESAVSTGEQFLKDVVPVINMYLPR